MLAAHPDVSEVPSETNLFSRGIGPLLGGFHHGLRGSSTVGSVYVERDELLDATRDFCDRVLHPYLREGTDRLAERTSLHVEWVATIAAVYPDARLVHIVRDGRDVARSLIARDWGPDTVAQAAEQWRSGIAAAREGAPGERYREVRYEELLIDPERELTALYRWLGLPVDAGVLDAALWEARTARNEDPTDPRLAEGKWRDAFGPVELESFHAVAGDLLAELGYDTDAPPHPAPGEAHGRAPAPRGPLRAAVRGRLGSPLRRARAVRPQVGGDLTSVQRCIDAVLEAVHVGAPERARPHLAEQVRMRIVERAGDCTLYGADSLIAWFRADAAGSGRQLRADPHPGLPCYAVVLSYRLPDGSREDRTLAFVLSGSKVEELTLYRFPDALADGSGSRSGE